MPSAILCGYICVIIYVTIILKQTVSCNYNFSVVNNINYGNPTSMAYLHERIKNVIADIHYNFDKRQANIFIRFLENVILHVANVIWNNMEINYIIT